MHLIFTLLDLKYFLNLLQFLQQLNPFAEIRIDATNEF